MSNNKSSGSTAELFQGVGISEIYSNYAKRLKKVMGRFSFDSFYNSITNIQPKMFSELDIFLRENAEDAIKKEIYKRSFDKARITNYIKKLEKQEAEAKLRKKKIVKDLMNERTRINVNIVRLNRKEDDNESMANYHPKFEYILPKIKYTIFSNPNKARPNFFDDLIKDQLKRNQSMGSIEEIKPKKKRNKSNENKSQNLNMSNSGSISTFINSNIINNSTVENVQSTNIGTLGADPNKKLSIKFIESKHKSSKDLFDFESLENDLNNSGNECISKKNSYISPDTQGNKKTSSKRLSTKYLKTNSPTFHLSNSYSSSHIQGISFKKMSNAPRNGLGVDFDKENTIDNFSPCIGYYHPNLDYILPKSPQARIVIDGYKPKLSKKFLIQRLMKGFGDIPREYQVAKVPK